ncbi:cobalt-precorrin 5A hydrolase [Methanobacterium sp.]|uniref:cobalt-precorrin 5A hydrolase n=1 Tax=Methanobacterium sp. TaxID=2164 RepID=UPI003C735750
MKIAIITITKNSRDLASKILENLTDDPTIIGIDIFHKNVKKTLKSVFREYDCIIGIMATGIMVRNICGLLESKLEDPAVLVMDDSGKHVISLLSGHFGGANEITKRIAEITGADPVITTATDVHGKLGIDSLAKKYYLDIENPDKIKEINSALVRDEFPELFVPSRFEFIFDDPQVNSSYNLTKSNKNDFKVLFGDSEIILRPKKFVIGIGARKDISKENVQSAITSAMNTLKLPVQRIDMISTGEMKRNEKGILEVVSKFDISLKIIHLDKLKNFNYRGYSKSSFVKKKFGIYGVCEPAALIAAGNDSELVFKKTSFNGVTIAVAVASND